MFKTAHDALVFAYHFSSQQYSRSPMARIAQMPTREGKGLGGIDGAAQAGMIRYEVERLGRTAEAIIIARYAPKQVLSNCSCPNCRGYHPNSEWRRAAFTLAQEIRDIANAPLDVRFAYIERHFAGKQINFSELAKQYSKHENTFRVQMAKVKKWFVGQQVTVEIDGKNERRFFPGVEKRAITDIENRLRELKMINEE